MCFLKLGAHTTLPYSQTGQVSASIKNFQDQVSSVHMMIYDVHCGSRTIVDMSTCALIMTCLLCLLQVLDHHWHDLFSPFFLLFFSEAIDYKTAQGSSQYRFSVLARIVKHMKVCCFMVCHGAR